MNLVMPADLLRTKLFIPPVKPNLVARSRLESRLNEGVNLGQRFFLVSAPAGFGKSTLISLWRQKSGLDMAWLTLDESDNDPARFWRYAIASLQTVFPGFAENLQTALQSPQPPPINSLVNALLNELSLLGKNFIFVLDDYHLIENQEIHQSITYLLDHLPAGIYTAILSRADPPFNLSRFRGRSDLCEVRATDLRFNLDESLEFLNQKMRLDLTLDDVKVLGERTEGWIVGLQMAAISLQGILDRHAFIEDFNGDDRYIADYLLEETLSHQPAHIRDFLLKTSILSRMNAPLCDELVGRSDSQAILNQLERANLFIIPLDNRREWFRYHHLFASLLRQMLKTSLSPAEVVQLYRQVCQWYEQAGLFAEAVETAIAAEDYETATRLIKRATPGLFYRNELTTLLQWSDVLPESLVAADPHLCMIFSWAANATSHNKRSLGFLRLVEAYYGTSLASILEGKVSFASLPVEYRSAYLEGAVVYARILLDQPDLPVIRELCRRVTPFLTPEHDNEPFLFNPPSNLYPAIRFIQGMVDESSGNLDEASTALEEAILSAREKQNYHIVALALGHLGDIQTRQARLHRAQQTFSQVIQSGQENPSLSTNFIALSRIGLGNLFYEWNLLSEALNKYQAALELARLWTFLEGLVPGYLFLSRCHAAQGDYPAAYAALEKLEAVSDEEAGNARLAAGLYRAYLDSVTGNHAAAEAWIAENGADAEKSILYLHGKGTPLLAHTLINLKQSSHARSLLDHLQAGAESSHRWGDVIEILVLQALALQAESKEDAAVETLARAMTLAEPEGYLRTFLDGGEPLRSLIKARQGHLPHEYAARLLSSFAGVDAHPLRTLPQPKGSLVEPLSPRELEVLHLVVAGKSNAEIAASLVLSLNTVKKHISNIFGKLGVTTRLQAVELARKSTLLKE